MAIDKLTSWNKGDPVTAERLNEPVNVLSNLLPITGGGDICVAQGPGGTVVYNDSTYTIGYEFDAEITRPTSDYTDNRYYIQPKYHLGTDIATLSLQDQTIMGLGETPTAINLWEKTWGSHLLRAGDVVHVTVLRSAVADLAASNPPLVLVFNRAPEMTRKGRIASITCPEAGTSTVTVYDELEYGLDVAQRTLITLYVANPPGAAERGLCSYLSVGTEVYYLPNGKTTGFLLHTPWAGFRAYQCDGTKLTDTAKSLGVGMGLLPTIGADGTVWVELDLFGDDDWDTKGWISVLYQDCGIPAKIRHVGPADKTQTVNPVVTFSSSATGYISIQPRISGYDERGHFTGTETESLGNALNVNVTRGYSGSFSVVNNVWTSGTTIYKSMSTLTYDNGVLKTVVGPTTYAVDSGTAC